MLDMSFIPYEEHICGYRFEKELGGVVYRHTHDVRLFLHKDAPELAVDIILVTHNSDNPVTDDMVSMLQNLPKISMWFGQNIDCKPHPKVFSLPIGLENDHWFPEVAKRKRLVEFSKKNISPSKLLYMNFSFGTNIQARHNAYREFVGKNWVTDKCVRAVDQSVYVDWLTDVLQHEYVLCPRGNGIDTHRLWETLYLGRIPIVLRCENTRYYDRLPILPVDSWDQVTEEYLLNSLPYFSNNNNFDLNMLKMSWWKNTIKAKISS